MTKITLVTGASRGLGRNTALSTARHGGDVVLTYHSRSEDAQAAVAEIQAMGRKAIAFQLDTGDVTAFAPFADALRTALRKTWSRETIDHLVNNAGHGDYALIGQTTEAQFDALVNVHFKGVYFLCQTLLPLIADGGRIVNLSSGLESGGSQGIAVVKASGPSHIEVAQGIEQFLLRQNIDGFAGDLLQDGRFVEPLSYLKEWPGSSAIFRSSASR
jgi:NAD(P)-dependent dehydrogenase (short-subunit alcohol dehydrogenase family)